MGSMDHFKLFEENLSSNSSPIIESLGKVLFISDRMYFSKALSKFVTGSKSFLDLDLLFTFILDLDFFYKISLILKVIFLKS